MPRLRTESMRLREGCVMWEIWEVLKNDTPTIVGVVAGAILWAFILGLKLGENIWR